MNTRSNNNDHSLPHSNNNDHSLPPSNNNLDDHIIITQPGLPTQPGLSTRSLANYNSLHEPPVIARQVYSSNVAVPFPADLNHASYGLPLNGVALNRTRSSNFHLDHHENVNENTSLHPDKHYTSYVDYLTQDDQDILNSTLPFQADDFPPDVTNMNELFRLYLRDSNSNNISFETFKDNFILTPEGTPETTPQRSSGV